MRRQLSFPCHGHQLAATLDVAEGATGVLIVTGGTEIRSGAHGGLAQLARRLAHSGYPVFRFERRGVGDSEGEDPGFAGCVEDLVAARGAFVDAAPGITRVIGLGHCDGATALSLHAPHLDLSGLILVNPWIVEPSAGLPPPAAIRQRYAERLVTLEGWKRIATGSLDFRKALSGLRSIVRKPPQNTLASRVAAGLSAIRLPIELIVARRDATAIAFMDAWRGPGFRAVRERSSTRAVEAESRSHSFARDGEPDLLARLCLAAIGRMAAK